MDNEGESQRQEVGADGCPLSRAHQMRNLWIFALCFWLTYLAAPITYIGKNQAALCQRLGASDKIANLPATLYFATSFIPVFWAWYLPYVSWLRWNAVICYAASTAGLAAVAGVLVTDLPPGVKIAMVALQGAVAGVSMNAGAMFLWEAIARGVAESRRGLTLGLTFGAGPVLAALSSLLSQTVLPPDKGGGASSGWLPFPYNFALMYAMCVPIIGTCIFLTSRLVVPELEKELVREPFVAGVFGGAVNFLRDRVLLVGLVVVTLIYTGNLTDSNLGLYTRQAQGVEPEEYSGYQNFLRFGTKAFAGLFLGWLLARTHPKAGLLATGTFFLGAQLWAIGVNGPWYAVTFCLYGAGELIGVYGPNYILTASRKADMRRNLAIISLLNTLSSPAGTLFGAISDHYKALNRAGLGYRLSFTLCAGFIGLGLLLALVGLPARPKPKEEPAPTQIGLPSNSTQQV